MSGDGGRRQLHEQLSVLYDDLRTACFNKKYYGRQLTIARRSNNATEFILAITASGTGIGSWEAFQAGIGHDVWVALATASALIAILKPIVKLADRVERYAKLHGEYSKLFATLQSVAGQVRMNQSFTPELQKVHQTAQATFSKLADDDDPSPSARVLKELQRQVNEEIPADRLWLPGNHAQKKHAQD
ncbi:MAG: hypothetical protein KGJ66_07175 [Alphaproteobacteria bacterium]|nr:hypothetical protein [Alphaproteobacteria bacterium]